MKRPIIIWLICTILLTLCVIISGCRTGGTTLSTGNLQKGSDGIWRLKKAPSVAPIRPKTIVEEPQKPIIITNVVTNVVEVVKASPIPLKPVKSKPTIEELKPAEAVIENLPPIKGVGEPTPFSPSISPTPKLIEGDGGCTPQLETELEAEPIDSKIKVSSSTSEPPNTLKIHWLVFLFGFVMLALIIYDIVKEFINNKKPTTKATKNEKRKPRAKRPKKIRKPRSK